MTPDEDKTKEQLLQELETLRRHIAEIEQTHQHDLHTLRQSEQKYSALIANIPDVIWTTDAEGKTTFISPNVEELYGYKPEEIYKQGAQLWFGRVHPDDILKVKDAYEALFKKAKRFDIEYRIKRKDEKWIWLHDRAIATYEKDGVMYADGLFSDITKRKKAEEKIKQIAKQWSTTFDSITDLVSIQSKDFKIVKVNKAFAELFKLRPEELIGKFCYEVIHCTKEPWPTCSHKRVLQTGKPATVEYFEPNLGIYLQVSTSPIFNDSGEITGTIHIAKDITEHKKTEEQLCKSEEKYRSLIENADDFIYVVDKSGHVMSLNKAATELFGKKAEEIIGKSLLELFPEEIANHNIQSIKTVFETGETLKSEIKLRVGERQLWVSANLNPLKDSEGKIYAVMGISRNITQRKKAEDQLRDYSKRMARAEQLATLGSLGAALAHQLTQPLSVINLLIENALTELKKTHYSDTVADKLRDVLTEVSRINSVAHRFREAAKRSSERIIKEIDLKAVAERTLKLCDESGRRAKVTMHLKDFDGLPFIYTNEEELEQVFFALVDNAIQAADGKKAHQLVISAALKDKHIELRFSDNCGGIAPEHLDKVFEPFFTTKPAGEATGLGLCIVEYVVSRAGGKVRVESKSGEGTT
ncbi:MAG: PAS domain S-box protein, partial [Sedimentisphaerales bacterium]